MLDSFLVKNNAMPSDNTDDAIHPDNVNSIMAKALIGESPPSSMPHNNKGSAANARTERLAIVVDITANRLLRIMGKSACHCDAPFPKRKSY